MRRTQALGVGKENGSPCQPPLQPQALCPGNNLALIDTLGEADAFLPGAGTGEGLKIAGAAAKSRGQRRGYRDDGLAGEVVVGGETVDRPRRNRPPNRVGEDDRGVQFPIRRSGGRQGLIAQGLVLVLADDERALLVEVEVIPGVGLGQLNLEDVRAKGRSDLLGDAAGVTAFGVVGDESAAAC